MRICQLPRLACVFDRADESPSIIDYDHDVNGAGDGCTGEEHQDTVPSLCLRGLQKMILPS